MYRQTIAAMREAFAPVPLAMDWPEPIRARFEAEVADALERAERRFAKAHAK